MKTLITRTRNIMVGRDVALGCVGEEGFVISCSKRVHMLFFFLPVAISIVLLYFTVEFSKLFWVQPKCKASTHQTHTHRKKSLKLRTIEMKSVSIF